MSGPTLLARGSLRVPADAGDATPIEYIVNWLKARMPEFGGHGAALEDRVLVVQSETGSGKSTVLPVHVFRILRSEKTPARIKYRGGSVLCTQPRVLTAIDLARRQVGGAPHYPDMVLGETVGFQTGPFSEKPPNGLVFATIGVLAAQLRVMEDDAIMSKYRFIIVDEAHERSREADATLLKLKYFYARNVGNKKLPFLILASATINVKRYADFFEVGPANTVEVTGRQYPVNEHWPTTGTNDYPKDSARKALEIHESETKDPPERADILIFVPGDAEIKAVRDVLEKKNKEYAHGDEGPAPGDEGPAPFLLLAINREAIVEESPEFRLVSERVHKLPLVGTRKPARRIIISTVVAETGLTIETLRHVIDCGWSRTIETYQPQGLTGLITAPAPQSRIKQRRGRVGRLFAGEFYPMYTKNVFDALAPQQLPDIATGGMNDIFLDLVGEQQRQKKRLSQLPEFRVEDIELLDAPPVDALQASLEASLALGFVSDGAPIAEGATGYGLTPLGQLASKLSRVPLECARMIMAGFLWGCSIRDLVTVAALAGKPVASLLDREYRMAAGTNTVKQLAALRASLPIFLSSRREGGSAILLPPTEEEAFLYRVRLLIADSFIESLMVFDMFARQLDKADGDIEAVTTWCTSVGLDMGALLGVTQKRDEMLEDLLAAGIDPFWGEEHRISASGPATFIDLVKRIKRCLYDGFRLKTLAYDEKENVYVDRFGTKIDVPPAFTDAEIVKLRPLGIDLFRKPKYIVTDSVVLKAVKQGGAGGVKPLLYKPQVLMYSVLDGFVDFDLDFVAPRGV